MLVTLTSPAPTTFATPARVTLLRLQDGLYATRAVNAEASRANAGRIVPTLVHTISNGVLVVDPGPCARWEHHLIAAIRHITAESIRWVINTHVHPEHMLASAAFAQLQPHSAFLASAAVADLVCQHCETCLTRPTVMLNVRVMYKTEIAYPEPTLRDGDQLHTGKTVWQTHVCTAAYSVSDTVLHAPQCGMPCTGDLAYLWHISNLQDSSLAGWHQILHALVQLPVNTVVGTAIGTPTQILRPAFAYLDILDSMVIRVIESGGDATRALTYIPGGVCRDWCNLHSRRALNVGRAWREFEDHWM